ncbi:hypothetical protein CVT26_004544 [Gymnopilus dilepis]|uniref:Uncharacterized protein n=1 Tax=Gymnopilus dilepis TaxID=231916 RepID=A0A409YJ31_9AGAR|nr:hypothetical protein CVT26_004544 [Gymnopilus dilepis]
MYYPASASTVTSFVTPAHYPVSRSYYPTAPMSAVLPGQHYYPSMHAAPMAYPATAAPVMVGQPAYGAMPYYGQGQGPAVSWDTSEHPTLGDLKVDEDEDDNNFAFKNCYFVFQ